tara:strand:- start:1381 stop:1965 length:585 start_codon:yes stop_codon:yes gene_type:complete
MRVLIIILVLVFSLQSWSKADDISDFEIEGMSVGDSLLDHFTKKKITNAIKYGSLYPNSNKFLSVYIDVKKGRYNNFQFAIKPNDENYIIYSVEGEITYQNNMEECLKQQKIVIEDLKNFFPNVEIISKNSTHEYDKKSFTWETYFPFNNGSSIGVFCYDWSEEMLKEKGWEDSLKVVIDSEEFINFLRYEAYK